MGGKRQHDQLELDFTAGGRGEAPSVSDGGSEPSTATRVPESPADSDQLMEVICQRENLVKALGRVQSNKGSPGVDLMTVEQLGVHLREHWPAIRSQLLAGTYKPQPVRRVSIPKPDGGMRQLGIPTALDRFVQQAVLQVLQEAWDPTFSEHSYGFRPGRSAHQAISQAQAYVAAGDRWVVDIDLERFFDRVPQDRLMARVAHRVRDKRVLKLIRAFLNAGAMSNGLVEPTREGTPQGGPLSPLLSNLVLDELDRELERRGHRFVRYADDCNIYVRSERAGHRVMASVTRFIGRRLRLTVNVAKSAVARAEERSFLGFSVTSEATPRRRIAPKAFSRLRRRVRQLTRASRGISLRQMVGDLARYLRGWRSYYGFCETPWVLENLDRWIRRRLRCVIWKHWKRGRRRYRELHRRGVRGVLAARTIACAQGPWRASRSQALAIAFPNAFFDSLGLPRLADR